MSSLETILFTHVNKEPNARELDLEGIAIGIGFIRITPEIDSPRGSIIWVKGTSKFYKKQPDYKWYSLPLAKVPAALKAWCAATGRPYRE